MQMGWIKKQLAPHAARIQQAENPMAALAHQAYEMVKSKVLKVVNNDFGSGKLVLLGGIQINMPAPYCDHFLPLTFEVHQGGGLAVDLMQCFSCPLTQQGMRVPAALALNEDETRIARRAPTTQSSFNLEDERAKDTRASAQHHVFSWLNWSPQPESVCYQALHRHFPGALPGQVVHARSSGVLTRESHGCTPENTLFGLSICPDEINYEAGGLAQLMKDFWGEMFPLGGISGAPFSGKTGFSAFSHHVPVGGNVLVLFGPHVAISETGEVGKCHRQGQKCRSAACGAVIGAYHSCTDGHVADEEFDETDMQMAWIKKQIAPHVARIRSDENPMAALAHQAYEMVRDKVLKVVNNDFGTGKLVLIGGIQINMPSQYEDHFLPCMFEVRDGSGDVQDLLPSFSCSLTQNRAWGNA
jgi:nitrogen fixation protein